jgi:hypothetical protein
LTVSPDRNRLLLFDGWAASYDHDVEAGAGFPFDGYRDLLRAAVEIAPVLPGISVLDVGTGAGNLASHFDVIASAYDFHEFHDRSKLVFVNHLMRDHLHPQGHVVIAGIGYEPRIDLENAPPVARRLGRGRALLGRG